MQHPEHPSVQSHREGILLCTEAQKDALAARLFFFLARSIGNALVTTETAKSLNSDRLGLVQRNFFWPFFSIFNSERCSVGLLFPTYRAQKLMKRGRGGVGDEGIYGGGSVGHSGTRRICACRPHHGRSNDMRLEEFGLHLRELEVIEICARWGVFPMYSEFSLFAASP